LGRRSAIARPTAAPAAQHADGIVQQLSPIAFASSPQQGRRTESGSNIDAMPTISPRLAPFIRNTPRHSVKVMARKVAGSQRSALFPTASTETVAARTVAIAA
jgi:hypothetical protein